MCRLLETIRCSPKGYDNLDYHERRMNAARRERFGCTNSMDLSGILSPPKLSSDTIEKCRVVYRETIEHIEYLPYAIRPIKSLRLVYDDSIDYSYKYEDRKDLDRLFVLRNGCDDILIVKNGLVTDTSFSNIAFFTGSRWVTPAFPLLHGTRRQKLLDSGIIFEERITPDTLPEFLTAKLINSMIRFQDALHIEMKHII